MARFKIRLEYEGTRFSGWQVQNNARTVQGEIMHALADVLDSDDFDFGGAGRTDAGVHALEQYAHLDCKTMLSPKVLQLKINDRLPYDINILGVEKAGQKFHARHDATSRLYVYQISTRRTAFGKRFVWWIKDTLNVEAMADAAGLFTGMHDYVSFSSDSPEEKSTKVQILDSVVEVSGDLILIRIHGSHFLWNQVRRMVGALVEVGRGTRSPDDIRRYLSETSSEPAKMTAPPSGLFLERVFYSREAELPEGPPLIWVG